MGFHFQQISKYGTSTPAVARTLLQGSNLLQAFSIDKKTEEKVKELLFELQQHLIRCVDCHKQVSDEVNEAVKTVESKAFESRLQGLPFTAPSNLPSVKDLQPSAESFLQGAKLAIGDCGRIFNPFYGTSFDHRFNRVSNWAKQKFGPDNDISRCADHWEPFIQQVLNMRNAVDHPRDEPGGKLNIHNFLIIQHEGNAQLLVPTWALSGDDPTSIVLDMGAMIEHIIRLSEDVLSICLMKSNPNFPIVIQEIPEDERDPKCPVRLRAGINLPIKKPKPF